MEIRNPFLALAAIGLVFGWTTPAVAVEEAKYAVVQQDDDIEVRDYEPSLLAEMVVKGDFEKASSAAFRPLFKYIDGNNSTQGKIAMTAPVGQQQASQKIAMTAPVGQSKSADGWSVSFMMPAEFTMESIPLPADPRVKLREVPAWRAAAIRYSGTWSKERYQAHLDRLMAWIELNDFAVVGDPIWARYNAPFTPWFMRRNEILVPISRS